MAKAVLVLDKMPKTCSDCPIFVHGILGQPAYCTVGAEYTPEEIAAVRNGNLRLYYDGCLPNRPKLCPLKESKEFPWFSDEETKNQEVVANG